MTSWVSSAPGTSTPGTPKSGRLGGGRPPSTNPTFPGASPTSTPWRHTSTQLGHRRDSSRETQRPSDRRGVDFLLGVKSGAGLRPEGPAQSESGQLEERAARRSARDGRRERADSDSFPADGRFLNSVTFGREGRSGVRSKSGGASTSGR